VIKAQNTSAHIKRDDCPNKLSNLLNIPDSTEDFAWMISTTNDRNARPPPNYAKIVTPNPSQQPATKKIQAHANR